MAEMRRALADPRARVMVLFLDPRFVEPEDSMRIRRPLIDALNRLIGGDDLIAVMTPEMSPGASHLRGGPAASKTCCPGIGAQEGLARHRDPLEVRDKSCYDRPSIVDGPWMAREMIARRRELRTLDALDDLVQHLRGLREERKAVITVTDGWPCTSPTESREALLIDPSPASGQTQVPVPKMGADPEPGESRREIRTPAP